jgi:hypothetical protein
VAGNTGMTLVEKRNRSRTPDIEPDLLDQGIAQLSLECQIITDWLSSLDSAKSEPRRVYQDMLRSRHEMLLSLEQQRERISQCSTSHDS